MWVLGFLVVWGITFFKSRGQQVKGGPGELEEMTEEEVAEFTQMAGGPGAPAHPLSGGDAATTDPGGGGPADARPGRFRRRRHLRVRVSSRGRSADGFPLTPRSRAARPPGQNPCGRGVQQSRSHAGHRKPVAPDRLSGLGSVQLRDPYPPLLPQPELQQGP